MISWSNRLAVRLPLTYLAVILIISILLGIILPFSLKTYFLRSKEQDLLAKARQISALVSQLDESEANPETISDLFSSLQAYSGENIVILTKNGEWLMVDPLSSRAPRRRLRAVPALIKAQDISPVWQGGYLLQTYQFTEGEGVAPRAMIAAVVPITESSAQYQNSIRRAVLVYAPVSSVLQMINAILRVILFSFLISSLVAGLFGLFLAHSISKPLLAIAAAASQLAGGDYTSRIRLKRQDELGVLADAFNHLSGQLAEASQQTARIEQMRRDFLTNVSHELRAPLTLIRGYTEALLDEEINGTVNTPQFLTIIKEEAIRMEHLIADLLDLGRLQSGKVTLATEVVDAGAIIDAVATRFSYTAQERGITLIHPEFAQSIRILADPRRLEQIILIFLDNALKFTPAEGFIRLTGNETESVFEICVQDSGIGIPPEDIDLIWERFHKVDKSHSGRDSGTGLGLAIAKQLIEMQGGSVRVESAVGQGSVFCFSLPKASAETSLLPDGQLKT